jgi:hypothetical protein
MANLNSKKMEKIFVLQRKKFGGVDSRFVSKRFFVKNTLKILKNNDNKFRACCHHKLLKIFRFHVIKDHDIRQIVNRNYYLTRENEKPNIF